jgi:predicted transposase/invertase (TIGR01784 family)
MMIHSFRYYDVLNQIPIPIPDSQTTIVTIELPKLEHYFAEKGKTSGLGYWSSFFRHSKKDQHLAKEYKFTMEATQVLERKKRDDHFMQAYKQAKDILDDEESQLKTYSYNRYKLGQEEGLEKGRAEGLKKGLEEGRTALQNEMIQSLKQAGMDIDAMARILKLPVDVIKSKC